MVNDGLGIQRLYGCPFTSRLHRKLTQKQSVVPGSNTSIKHITEIQKDKCTTGGGYKNLPSHISCYGVCSVLEIERTSARLSGSLNLDGALICTCSACFTRSFSEICKIYMNNTARVFYGQSECFYCGLFKNAVGTASQNIVIDELGRIWKEQFVAHSKRFPNRCMKAVRDERQFIGARIDIRARNFPKTG